jgi:hypothetical protein
MPTHCGAKDDYVDTPNPLAPGNVDSFSVKLDTDHPFRGDPDTPLGELRFWLFLFFQPQSRSIMPYFIAGFAVLIALALCVPEASEARNYNGTWKSADGVVVAKIQDHKITVDLNFEDDPGWLYWKGTFKSTGNRILSKADTKALAPALFGSGDKTKLFVYRGGRLHFHMSMMEVSKVISLRRTA